MSNFVDGYDKTEIDLSSNSYDKTEIDLSSNGYDKIEIDLNSNDYNKNELNLENDDNNFDSIDYKELYRSFSNSDLDNYEQEINFADDDFGYNGLLDQNTEIFDTETNSQQTSWTKEQMQVLDISNSDKNMLVSASAGSGKTAVMTQRIVNLVYQKKIPISNFLVVTFTNASAQEMKIRIINKLKELPQDEFVLEQIDSVSTSDISDLHSFYSRLISTYFYEVEVDPSYHIIDDIESTYLKNRAITKLFEQKEKNSDEKYFHIFDCFQQKRNDEFLKKTIFNFKNYLDSHIDGEKWFYETIESAYNTNLNENICAKFVNDYVCELAREYANLAEEFSNKALSLGSKAHYEHFSKVASILRVFSKDKSFIVNAKNANELKMPRYPTIRNEEYVFLNDEGKPLNAMILDDTKKFKDIFTATSEEEITLALENSKQTLLNLYELVKEFSAIYAGLKKDINGLDFTDLEKFAYKILLNESICKTIKEKYKFIFVDEYQDVNGLQEKIISMISSSNNRFMVGDLKQSIYGFRLCDPEIFLEKYRLYTEREDSLIVKLNKNFRSDKNILKFVDKIFCKTMTEKFGGINYATESVFTAGDSNINLPKSVNLCYIDTGKEKNKEVAKGTVYSVKNHINEEDEETRVMCAEAKYVSDKIAEIKLEAKEKGEDVKNSDFAVLVFTRKGVKIPEFIETLRGLGVPVSSDEKNKLMEKNYIQEIVNFIKYVANYRDDYLLFKVLKSRLFDFSDSEITEIRKLSLNVNFFETINLSNRLENEQLKQKIEEFLGVVKKYKKLAQMMSIKDFAKLLIKDFKIENINLISADGETLNEHTHKFISALPSVSVNEFLINYSDFELEIQNECGGDSVQVMTVHKSKGIEFKYVFIINTCKEINFDSTKGKVLFNKNFGVGAKYFDVVNRIEHSTIPLEAIKIYEKKKIAEEQQRLLYVALTRAKIKLFVVCSTKIQEIKSNFPAIPRKYIDWFNPIILEMLDKSAKMSKDFDETNNEQIQNDKQVDKVEKVYEIEKVDKNSKVDEIVKSNKEVSFTISTSDVEIGSDYIKSIVFDSNNAESNTIFNLNDLDNSAVNSLNNSENNKIESTVNSANRYQIISDDCEIVFEQFKLEDFSADFMACDKQIIFSNENDDLAQEITEKYREFVYKYNSSVSVPLKNSVSKILRLKNQANEIDKKLQDKNNVSSQSKQSHKQKKGTVFNNSQNKIEHLAQDIDDEYEIQELKLSEDRNQEIFNYYAQRGTAYHKVFEMIDFYDMDNIDNQLENISKILNESLVIDNSLVDYDVIKNVLKLPIFAELKDYNVLKEREFFASYPATIYDKNLSEKDKIMMQGVIDLFAIGENDLIVLDYKTGKYSDEKFEDYKFQLEFYSSICERKFPNKQIRKMICFIDEQKIIDL